MVVVLMVVLMISAFVGISIRFSTQHNRIAARQRDMMESLAAADGAMEYAFAVWKDVVRGNGMRAPTTTQVLNDQRVRNMQAPNNTAFSPAKELAITGNTVGNFTVTATDPWGTPAADPNAVSRYTVSVDGYPGWKGFAYFYKTSVRTTGPRTLTGPAPVTAGVTRYFSLTNVPLFQAAIFYMDDLEIHPGALMTIKGLVHTNANLYASGFAKLQFLGNVSYVNSFNESALNYDWTGSGSTDLPTMTPYWSDDRQTGTSTQRATQLSAVDRIEPFGKKPQELFNTTDTNPNNDGFHEWIEPPVAGQPDPQEIADQRLYNKAGLRIQIDSSKAITALDRITVTDGYGNPLTAAQDTAVKTAIEASTTIYDWREGNGQPNVASGNVKVTNVDMKKLNTAIGTINGFNGVVYVYDVATGKNAIRLKNGATLTRDLTVASVNPVYVQGDYNTGWGGTGTTHDPNYVPSNDNGGNTNGTESPVVPGYAKKSAAIIADAVVILSNNWNDTNSTKTVGNRQATPTTVNAAMMTGQVPTNYNNNGLASGGAHNFPRFLEQWYNANTQQFVDFTYYGSMVEAFNSKTFTGGWRTGNVYVWPNRKWNYEEQFNTNPPPGTVQATKFSRGRWERL